MTRKNGSIDSRTTGFSLTELMIVIVIVSILATVAIPIYARYIRKSRTSEAISNLGTIAMFEETYFSEADSYITTGANPATVPNPSNAGGRLPFNSAISGWNLLGRVIPNGTPLYFQYEVRAGQYDAAGAAVTGTYLVSPSTAQAVGTNCATNSVSQSANLLSIPSTASSNWFYATATGDQKGGSGSRGQGFCSRFIKVIDRPDIITTNEID